MIKTPEQEACKHMGVIGCRTDAECVFCELKWTAGEQGAPRQSKCCNCNTWRCACGCGYCFTCKMQTGKVVAKWIDLDGGDRGN